MLTMRVTPKMSERPAARKNSDAAFARPFRAWSARTSSGSLLLRGAQLPYFGIARLHGGAVDVLEVDHRALALLHRGLADPGAHRALVIDGAISDRPRRCLDLQARECPDQLFGVGATRLGDARGERLHRDVADQRSQARVVAIALLVGIHERLVLGRIDLVPRVTGDDPALRRLVLQRIEIFRLAGQETDHRFSLEQ